MGSRLPFEISEPSPQALTALWEALCEDSQLADLPYKVETNERGQLLMSPAGVMHGLVQAQVVFALRQAMDSAGCGGKVVVEVGILTTCGVKVPDVAWLSDSAWACASKSSLLTRAPAICIEVLSPSNTDQEIDAKAQVYFANGAAETWAVTVDRRVVFRVSAGAIERSRVLPGFPALIAVD
jgi:Uma2 family endonuclease